MKKNPDWLLIFGVMGGALAGAVGIASAATSVFELYVYGVGDRSAHVYFFDLTVSSKTALFWDYDWPPIMLWAGAGLILGAYLGALAVSVLRFINRH